MDNPLDRVVAAAGRIAGGQTCSRRTPTIVPRLGVRRSVAPTDPGPAIFDTTFYLLVQGRKSMVFHDERLEYAAGRYAVSSVGRPFSTQVTQATEDEPYLGVELGIDVGLVAGILREMPVSDSAPGPPIDTALADDDLLDTVGRLLRLVDTPDDVATLAPLFERELYYRLLRGPTGATLRQVVPSYSRFGEVRAAIEWMSTHFDRPVRIEDLAARVGMSVTTFHRHFKAVTGESPLAYQRLVRLLAARELLITEQRHVTSVAFEVGYGSAAQFSREYKRLFGVPPSHDVRATGA